MDIRKERHAYNHRKRALERHVRLDRNGNRILMKMTFEEWLKVWVDSGKLHLRGSKSGHYVMSRHDDIGHYEVGNVFIQLHEDNIRQGHLGRKRSQETIDRIAKALEGKRQGVNNGFYGKKHSEETLAKLRKVHSRPRTEAQRKAQAVVAKMPVTCPHCGTTSNGPAMRRWHFGNCRQA